MRQVSLTNCKVTLYLSSVNVVPPVEWNSLLMEYVSPFYLSPALSVQGNTVVRVLYQGIKETEFSSTPRDQSTVCFWSNREFVLPSRYGCLQEG
jgi:hypothetical protein